MKIDFAKSSWFVWLGLPVVDDLNIHAANVIVFIRAIDHVITMSSHVTRKRGWHKHHTCPKSNTVFPRVYILLPRVTQVTRVTA